jgi:hypothetical protein
MFNISLIFLLIFTVIFETVTASDLLTHSRYSDMRANFLNINEDFYSEIDISSFSGSEMNDFLGGKGTNSPLLALEKTGGKTNFTQNIFGALHSCKNSYGEQAACWYSTGGTLGAFNEPDCGVATGDDYTVAITDDSRTCNVPDAGWSGWRFWTGTGSDTLFLEQRFPGAVDMPLNRICAEIEFPGPSELFFGYSGRSDIDSDPLLLQLVNPNVAGDHLKEIVWEFGTYTATKTDSAGNTKNEEYGGMYQPGGSHFYHKPTSFDKPPADKIFAINQNTLVICMGDIPTGVRSDARPTYAANPMLTLGGVDSSGKTTAANYLNYITRIYWNAEIDPATLANYPFDIKINKLWVMYEENEIIAFEQGGRGNTLGLEMTKDGESVINAFTLWNDADETRQYRVLISHANNLILSPTSPDAENFKIFEDTNNNGLLDSAELSNQILPNSTILMAPNENKSFLIEITPDFNHLYAKERHGRKFFHGTIGFVEQGRLRSASYAVRVWEDTGGNINKSEFYKDTQYPLTDSLDRFSYWFLNDEFNFGKDIENNPDLIRNNPDFINIIEKIKSPKPPTSLSIN